MDEEYEAHREAIVDAARRSNGRYQVPGAPVPIQRSRRPDPATGEERLDLDLALRRKPSDVLLRVQCRKGHPLVWVSDVDGRLVPTSSVFVGGGHRQFEGEVDDRLRLRDLRDWPTELPVPVGRCKCGITSDLTSRKLVDAVDRGQTKITLAATPDGSRQVQRP